MAAIQPQQPAGDVRLVLFCVADQWRGDTLGLLGTPGVSTPNLDALAADGVRFANHYCQASPCGPSRTSILTGTHLPTHRQWTNDHQADHGLVTLPGAMRDHGVRPILIGYTDTPQLDAALPSDPGPTNGSALIDPAFEVALPFIWQHGFPTWRAALERAGLADRFADGHPFGLYAPDGEPDASGLAPARYDADRSDVAFLTDAALAVIDDLAAPMTAETSDGEAAVAPVLLHLNWLRPHPPLTAPRPYHRLVDPADVARPCRPSSLGDQATAHPYFEATVPGRSVTEYLQRRSRVEDVSETDDRHLRAAYYGLCAEVDHQLGRLVDHLRTVGLYDSTMIVFTSDHGDALGDHWIYGRRGPFDGHFKVPCLIRDPRPQADVTRGATVDALTAAVDLLPTLCHAVGADAPSTVEGASLLDHLHRSPAAPERDHVRADMSWDDHLRSEARARLGGRAANRRLTMIRTDRHRLVTFPDLPPLLYDFVEDPDESIDRAGDANLAAVLSDLLDLAR